MLLFVCWSGTRSRAAAEAVDEWLPKLVPAIDVFYSPQIEKGSLWFMEVSRQLERADAGLICVTPENARSPWIHYEAGMLAAQSRIGNLRKIYTYLIGLDPAELGGGPLTAYQSTIATPEDTRRLIESLMSTNPEEQRGNLTDVGGDETYRQWWDGFERRLKQIVPIPVDKAVLGFVTSFARKTFDEALPDCSGQRWLDRYNGAKETLQKLKDRSDAVRAECAPYAAELYRQLIAEVDGYVDDLAASLLVETRFPRDEKGRTAIEPPGAVASCERRRKRIKALVADLTDPQRAPVFDEAAKFAVMETFEEKKNLIHRKTAEITPALAKAARSRARRKVERPDSATGSRRDLPEAFARASDSDWEFDRIISYIARELIGSCDVADAWSNVEREFEKFRSKSDESSLIPMHYSLGPLRKAVGENALSDEQVANLCGHLEEIDEVTRSRTGKWGRINESIAELLQLLRGWARASRSGAADGG